MGNGRGSGFSGGGEGEGGTLTGGWKEKMVAEWEADLNEDVVMTAEGGGNEIIWEN